MNPSHDVFISYSSKDKAVANAVCHVLEQHGISCWIAPRDVQPGIPYAREIISGIENCQLMILIFTCHSNISEHVASEIDVAFNKGKIIVPLLADETPMNEDLKYYLGRKHWLVAYPDFEQKFGELVQSVSNILGREIVSAALSTEKEQMQKVSSLVSEPQILMNTYLKVLSNIACRVLVDFEEKAIVEADCLYKLPLALGEYYVQFVSIDNNSDIIEKEISLLHGDVLERVDLKTVKRERQKKMERQKNMEWLPYIEGGKMGFKAKETGEVILEAMYDFVQPFSEGFASVKLNAKCGFIDKTGMTVVPCIYDCAECFSGGLACVQQDGKYGFVDHTGKLLVPCIYDRAECFSGGLACVQQDGKYGFVDHTGKLLVPCIYDHANSFSGGLACVRQDGKYGFVDQTGKLSVPCIYDRAKSFSGGLACVQQNDKYGFVDQSGRIIIPFIYDNGECFSEGLACVKQWCGYGFIDQTGKEIIPCIYSRARSFSEGLAPVELQFRRSGFIDRSGRWVGNLYEYVFGFRNGLSVVRNGYKNGYGFIDRTGKIVIPCIYDEACSFNEGDIACIKQNGKYGFINKSGDLLIPCVYDKAETFFKGFARVKQNDRNGIIDSWGNFMEL